MEAANEEETQPEIEPVQEEVPAVSAGIAKKKKKKKGKDGKKKAKKKARNVVSPEPVQQPVEEAEAEAEVQPEPEMAAGELKEDLENMFDFKVPVVEFEDDPVPEPEVQPEPVSAEPEPIQEPQMERETSKISTSSKTSLAEEIPLQEMTPKSSRVTSPAPKKNQVVPFVLESPGGSRPTSSQSMRVDPAIFSPEPRTKTTLSSTDLNSWKQPEWMPNDLANKLQTVDENHPKTEEKEETPMQLDLSTQVLLNKNERQYIPYDTAKAYIAKILGQNDQTKQIFLKDIRSLEEKYKSIEIEANGHFSAFVVQMKAQYSLKYEVMRKAYKAAKTDLDTKSEQMNGQFTNMKQQNGRLKEQLKCLLLAFKAEKEKREANFGDDMKEVIEKAETDRAKFNSEIDQLKKENAALKAGGAVAVASHVKNSGEPDTVVPDGNLVGTHDDEYVKELKEELREAKCENEELLTKIAAVEAGTVAQEKQVADQIMNDEELLEKFYTTQMQLELMEDQSELVEKLKSDVIELERKLAETEERDAAQKVKIAALVKALEEPDTSEDQKRMADLETHSIELEEKLQKTDNSNHELNNQLAEEKRKVEKLEKQLKQKEQFSSEVKRNPRRAATAVAAATVRGNRTGDNTQVKDLQAKIKVLERERNDLEKQLRKNDLSMTREKTMVQTKLNKTDGDLEKYKNRYEETKKKLKEQQDLCKEHTDKLKKLERSSKTHMKDLEKIEKLEEEVAKLTSEQKKMQKELREAKAEVAELTEKYQKEMLLRKKYYNIIEDMKGKVRVYCRSRPISSTEKERGNFNIVESADEYTVKIKTTNRGDKEFNFDQVFTATSKQEEVFDDTSFLLQSAFDGFNVCIFAYGQTGSGKTFTMIGNEEYPGIAPRAFSGIFDIIEENKDKFETKVSCYMMELYCDQIQDLFAGKSEAQAKYLIKKDKKGMVYVQGSVIEDTPDLETLNAAFDKGAANRKVASTKMNAESSRSHLIFSILLEVKNKTTGTVNKGKFSLIDLAGSERAAKTGATQQQLKEANSINKSLSALGDVIHALSTEAQFVPYRNNKLTELMQDSLGGNAKTLMFVNISPVEYNQDETVTSLTYAARVKEIKNTASKNADNKEVAKLKEIIRKLKAGETLEEEDEI